MKHTDDNSIKSTENLFSDLLDSLKKFISSIYRLALKLDLETIIEEKESEITKTPNILLSVKSNLGNDAGSIVKKNNHLFYVYLSGDYPFSVEIHTIPTQKLSLKSPLIENFKFIDTKIISPAILSKGRYLFKFSIMQEQEHYPFTIIVVNELT
ncbi:MAG: hypothetical protein RSB96_01210 [Oscillospiraceae bacterium]